MVHTRNAAPPATRQEKAPYMMVRVMPIWE